jgi:hypothetical protein
MLVAAAAGAAVLYAGSAVAAPTISYTSGATPGSFTAMFGDVPGGDFSDVFTSFTVGSGGGTLDATLGGFSALANSTFAFSVAELLGPGGTRIPFTLSASGVFESGSIVGAALTAGTYTLHFEGTGDSGTAYMGSLAFTPTGGLSATSPAPEPTAWALMILGFGAVGCALRGRGAVRMRLSYS